MTFCWNIKRFLSKSSKNVDLLFETKLIFANSCLFTFYFLATFLVLSKKFSMYKFKHEHFALGLIFYFLKETFIFFFLILFFS